MNRNFNLQIILYYTDMKKEILVFTMIFIYRFFYQIQCIKIATSLVLHGFTPTLNFGIVMITGIPQYYAAASGRCPAKEEMSYEDKERVDEAGNNHLASYHGDGLSRDSADGWVLAEQSHSSAARNPRLYCGGAGKRCR
ncbi:MAG TPA: hypothetical protein DCO86_03810 [Spirochaetaceae bacterium]|nr:hypothetical protein [Spirochaetaceae bacterium]